MRSGDAILVTGGAGYIGAHTAKLLAESGLDPVVFDDLSAGYAQAVRWGELVRGDIRDTATLAAAMERCKVRAVIHFAGLISVAESVRRPDLYYDVNVGGTRSVLTAMRQAGVERIVFSSSAAVYGNAASSGLGLIPEDEPKSPTSPYGDTKLIGEMMIGAYCVAFGLSGVALRYFNACGADASGLIGEAHEPETHLIPLAVDAAAGRRGPLTLFGEDYPTADGTCVRDYIHVADLAAAHLAAVRLDLPAGAFRAFNVGAGQGYSVRQIIDVVGRAAGRPVPFSVGPRRPGDPASLVADCGRAVTELGWRPSQSGLEAIVGSASSWHNSPAYGRATAA
jgi:UDP-glucose 4-epimerase/UDP-arabinose 4-epimerase